jgi:2,3-bisphosphoglycerate-independent phosphoglycerate mutase
LAKCGARIATVIGRYFAMDRDRRWDRTKKAWDAIVFGRGKRCETSPAVAVRAQYESGITDEFMPPLIFSHPDEQRIHDGDTVFFFNFRADRARQLSQAFLLKDFDGFDREVWPQVNYVTLTQYDVTYPSPFIFAPEELRQILSEVVSGAGKTQLRIAETEKYAHVTYFFSGGREEKFPGEDRVLVPSPRVATYDLKPEMSAFEVTDRLVAAVESRQYAAIICNFANSDMVGHTGIIAAAIKAIEALDICIGRAVAAQRAAGGEVLITADHGNAEMMFDPVTGQPHTAHTLLPVPFVYVGRAARMRDGGALQDVAPTLLRMMGLPQPAAMSGRPLIEFT